jgi:hypothetical protein
MRSSTAAMTFLVATLPAIATNYKVDLFLVDLHVRLYETGRVVFSRDSR